MNSAQSQHEFVVKQITTALKTCERKGVSADIAIQTILSVSVTMVVASQGTAGAAQMLESMAAAVRRGGHRESHRLVNHRRRLWLTKEPPRRILCLPGLRERRTALISKRYL